MTHYGCDLATLVEQTDRLKQVRKADLQRGDHVIIKTCNSVYSIRVVEDGFCVVSGGWFDRKGLSPMRTTVRGCTWGGSAIKMDIIAACGLCLEFGNRLVTTTIQKIFILPYGIEN